jgi:hypothetical protein
MRSTDVARSSKTLADLERRLHHVLDHIAPVHHAPDGENPSRDDEPVRADDPKQTHTELIGTGPIMGVQEQDLRDGVP